MHKLTGKQCRTARSLLKWNVYDLANRVSAVNARRIESFERGMVHIAEWENDEMVKAFRDEGVLFNTDLEVVLDDTVRKSKNPHAIGSAGAHITLDSDQTVLADSTAHVAPLSAEEEKEQSGQGDDA